MNIKRNGDTVMKYVGYILVLLMALFWLGCDKDDENPVAPDPEPSFTVFSAPFGQGLQFFGRCETDDVNLISVKVMNPANDWIEYNLGNQLAIKGQNFGCQDNNVYYYRVIGTWTMTFRGNKATGSKSSFEVTVQHTITAKEMP
jgi:hypothetical protein